jgi:uncharacterized membrane protein
MDLYPWLKLLHILGVFLFVGTHGVSVFVAFRLRGQTDRARLAALLDLSQVATYLMYVGLLTLLISGIADGIIGSWFTNGRFWLWAAVILLVVVTGAMYPMATEPLQRIRWSLGLKTQKDMTAELGPAPASDDVLQGQLAAWNPVRPAIVGFGGIVLITWLMVLKPF